MSFAYYCPLQAGSATAITARPCSSPPLDGKSLVVPVVFWSGHIHISVHTSTAHHSGLGTYSFADLERRHKPLARGSLSLHSSAAGRSAGCRHHAACTSAFAFLHTPCVLPVTHLPLLCQKLQRSQGRRCQIRTCTCRQCRTLGKKDSALSEGLESPTEASDFVSRRPGYKRLSTGGIEEIKIPPSSLGS